MIQNLIIRRARKSDCPKLLELIKGLASYVKTPGEVTISLDHLEESGFGQNPVWWSFVAEVNGKVCGFAIYYIRFSTWKGQRLYLEDLYISEEMRKQGIGKMLFDQLIIEAKEKNLRGIEWQVLEWNEDAIRFYKKYHAKFSSGKFNCSLEVS
ncbi:GNAT family N-acetyltransferase [Bacteroidales bacterium OttesenSCG-928-M11]|nr:GNAT family N-acetyltransferase [Bacteroidales bacterium OttesenSCG-928-M11]